jgi:hypothetical protein
MSGDSSMNNALANFSAAHEEANDNYAQALALANGPGDYIEAALDYMGEHVGAIGQLIDDLVTGIDEFDVENAELYK